MRYYSTQRPVMPGSYPKPHDYEVVSVCNFGAKAFCEEIGRYAWGYIEYESPLSAEDIENYELTVGKEN